MGRSPSRRSADLPPPATYSQYQHRQRASSNGHGNSQRNSSANGRRSGHSNGHSNGNGQSEKPSRSATSNVQPAGESGRRGFHPWHFLRITFRSASRASLLCNLLWPVVPAALAVRYALPDNHVLIFTLAYIAMVPCANLVGFAGQEFARKLPHVWGVLAEITFGSVVEIVLFMVLLTSGEELFPVIKAAILGSILATMLLCLGLVFFVGGLNRDEQTFDDAISEVGSGLLLTAGVVLAVPTIFREGLVSSGSLSIAQLDERVLKISHVVAILLIISYFVYVFFQARSHHGIYNAIFEHDEHRDRDGAKDRAKAKLTLTESIIGLAIGIALVTLIAVILVLQIEHIIGPSVSDAFMGLILVPLVEKFSEHLTAIDEAYDNQMNFALSHILGATLQTALFNAPLTIIVGWGLGKAIDLSFDVFNLIVLILSILTVGRFLSDHKSNYLEGFLLVTLYTAIAISAYYYPNPEHGGEGGH